MSLASELNERITIQQPTLSDDGYGGKTVGWTELATVSAAVAPLFVTQGERLAADQVTAYAGYRIRLRVRTDVTAAMQILWKTHLLKIHSLHEQGQVLSILAYEENL